MVFLLLAAGAWADPNEVDLNGVAATDQSADVGNDATGSPAYAPATPTPMSTSGAVGQGSYTTELWSDEDTATPDGVNVVDSTAAGSFALTGVVLDSSTGQPVAGASVTLTHYDYCTNCPPACADPPCPTPIIPKDTLTTSDSAGGFAFVNMSSVTGQYDLVVSASGYGSYEVDNIAESADSYYETTVFLDSTNQQYDASQTPDGTAAQDAAAATLGSGYVSETRVPPSILVALFRQSATCAKASTTFTLHRYPWRFYLLHTMVGEINATWGPLASRAVGSAIQNYAWYRAIRPSGAGGADIDNTTNHQCFKPFMPVPARFVNAAPDILTNRIAAGSSASAPIKDTQYKAGTANCGSGGVPADQLSQYGAKYLETNCGYTDWKPIVLHYYGASGATVQLGRVPPIPQTSFDRTNVSTGQLRLNFASKVSNVSRKSLGATASASARPRRFLAASITGYESTIGILGQSRKGAHDIPIQPERMRVLPGVGRQPGRRIACHPVQLDQDLSQVTLCFDGRSRRVPFLGGLALLAVTASLSAVTIQTASGEGVRRCLTAGEAARDRTIWGPALAVDVTGDGRVDRVRLVSAWRSPRRCRFFIVLSSGGRSTATRIDQPELTGLPNAELRAEHVPRLVAIVSVPGRTRDVAVTLLTGASTEFLGLYVPVGTTLRRVVIRPSLPDANLLPYNGSVTHFDGVDCASPSTVVTAGAGALGATGTRWVLERTWYRQHVTQLVRARHAEERFHGSFEALRKRFPVLSPTPFPHCAVKRAR